MSARGLPDELCDLIDRHIESMARAEVLLAVHGDGNRAWRAEEVASQLRIAVDVATTHLDALARSQLVDVVGKPPAYRYAPARPALHAAVEELRLAYDTRPVTLVRALYERPPQAVRSFADAFRIRDP